MPKFSKTSLKKLETCHEDLQRLCHKVIKVYDFSVLCGHRTREEQNKAYYEGFTLVNWPDSKHNKYPSLAVDIAPYPIDWNDKQRFIDLSKIMINTANNLNIKIKWGGHFRKLVDMPHYELNI